jgi:hypothetical protein
MRNGTPKDETTKTNLVGQFGYGARTVVVVLVPGRSQIRPGSGAGNKTENTFIHFTHRSFAETHS